MEKSKGEKVPSQKKPKDQPATDSSSIEPAQEEFGGPKGLEPSRYGDWERKGIVSDF
jgi:hypothetical protein